MHAYMNIRYICIYIQIHISNDNTACKKNTSIPHTCIIYISYDIYYHNEYIFINDRVSYVYFDTVK